MCRLPKCSILWWPVHRQHHGLCFRGHWPCIPAQLHGLYETRDEYAYHSGRMVMELTGQSMAADIITRKSLENRLLLLPPVARPMPGRIYRQSPQNVALNWICMMSPRFSGAHPMLPICRGRYVARDMYEIGGAPVLLKVLLDGGYIHGDCITVTGRTMAENLADVEFPTNQDVIRTTAEPLSPTGGVVGLRGNLAPEGALVKVAGMKTLKFTGTARCFDCEEDAFAAVERRDYKDGDVLVIRYEGPKGGPGSAKCCNDGRALWTGCR